MPVQLNSVNSIIQAYLKGREISQQKQNEETRKAERDEDIKREEQRFKDQQKLIKEQQDIENKRQEAIASYQRAQIDLDLASKRAKQFETTGNVPGYEPSGKVSGSISTTPGYATTASEMVPTKDNQDITAKPFSALEPGNAAEQARREEIQTLEQKEQIALTKLQEQNKAKAAVQAAEHSFKQEMQTTKLREDYIRQTEVQRLRNKGMYDRQALANTKAKVDAGTVKLPVAQQRKLNALNDIERALLEAKDLLDQDNYEYYQGPVAGILGEIKGFKGESNGTWADIETRIGLARQKYANAEEGAAFTAPEKELISSHIPAADHMLKPTKIKSDLNYLLQEIPRMRDDIYAVAGATNPNSPTKPPANRKPLAEILK